MLGSCGRIGDSLVALRYSELQLLTKLGVILGVVPVRNLSNSGMEGISLSKNGYQKWLWVYNLIWYILILYNTCILPGLHECMDIWLNQGGSRHLYYFKFKFVWIPIFYYSFEGLFLAFCYYACLNVKDELKLVTGSSDKAVPNKLRISRMFILFGKILG